MSLYHVWTVCYHLLQALLIWFGWNVLLLLVGIPDSFSFVGKCMVARKFLMTHSIFTFFFFLVLFFLEIVAFWIDSLVCNYFFAKEFSEDEPDFDPEEDDPEA